MWTVGESVIYDYCAPLATNVELDGVAASFVHLLSQKYSLDSVRVLS